MDTASKNVILLLEDIQFRGLSIDCKTQFSVQLFQLRSIFNANGEYYWWRSIDTKNILKVAGVFEIYPEDLIDCSCIDKLQNQVKSIRKVFSEILEYLDKLDDAISDSNSDSHRDEYINVNEYPRTIMYFFIWRIINLITRDGGDNEILNDNDQDLLVHVYSHLLNENSELAHNTSASVLLHQSNHGSTVLTLYYPVDGKV